MLVASNNQRDGTSTWNINSNEGYVTDVLTKIYINPERLIFEDNVFYLVDHHDSCHPIPNLEEDSQYMFTSPKKCFALNTKFFIIHKHETYL